MAAPPMALLQGRLPLPLLQGRLPLFRCSAFICSSPPTPLSRLWSSSLSSSLAPPHHYSSDILEQNRVLAAIHADASDADLEAIADKLRGLNGKLAGKAHSIRTAGKRGGGWEEEAVACNREAPETKEETQTVAMQVRGSQLTREAESVNLDT